MTVISEPNEYSVEGIVSTEGGNQRVLMTQNFEGTQQNYSETSVECIVEDSSGNKQRCVCVNNFGGGGSSGGVSSVNGQTGDVTLDADDVLPSQTDNAGKFITTDGTNASWGTINALQNTASTTATHSLTIEGTPIGDSVIYQQSINIGKNSKCNAGQCVIIGVSADGGSNSGTTLVGYATTAGSGSSKVGVGYAAMPSGERSICIGANAQTSGYSTIQIGGPARNNDAGTLKVCLGTNGSTLSNYELLNSAGLIPAARHAALPTADGTYTLKLTISDGTPTLSWVAD